MLCLLICACAVTGLWTHTHGYHYSYPTPPATPISPSFGGHFGSRPQTGFQHSSWQKQWYKYEWNKPSGHTNESSQTEHNHEMPPSDFTAKPSAISNNSRAVPGNMSKPVSTENDPMDHVKKNDSTTTTTSLHSTTTKRPPMNHPVSGPEPGTLSQPVPTLRELYAPSLQWHVGIYTKRFTPYMQVCGGSLVKSDVVLSAAHCFWDDNVGALRAGLFAVAAGKLLRPWETEGEIYTQHSDIKEIKIPPRFQGVKTSFQDDIAIVLLTTPVEYAPGVKPICVNFDLETERTHLKSGNLGKIAGWGLTMPNGPPSQRLNYLELPYLDIQECIRTAAPSFLKYITSDKICAGDQRTGRALCRGDSGGGLAYYSGTIPYLVGIASTAQRDGNQCNAYAVATFTYARAHSAFLLEHVSGLGEGCEGLYSNGTDVQNQTTIGVKSDPIQEEKVRIAQLGISLPNVTTAERTSNIVTNTNGGVTREPGTTDQKMVTMSVESGERSVVRVPAEGVSSFVCNCYCKN